jgi:N-acetylneuraminate lyase
MRTGTFAYPGNPVSWYNRVSIKTIETPARSRESMDSIASGHARLAGLIAATYTPLMPDGGLNLDAIPAIVDRLLSTGIKGLYVCGSTGEGMSLTGDERRAVASRFVDAAAGRVPVIVQVGHNSLHEARNLAEHALHAGADAISATCPSYFKPATTGAMLESMAIIASGAPSLPFYYYHIPALTGSQIDVVEFLRIGRDHIPNLVGLKYTDTKLHEFQECIELDSAAFDVVWGCDEMLLGALATGAKAAIGSTYNIAAPIYLDLIAAFQQGDLDTARRWQSEAIRFIRTVGKFPFHPAMKVVQSMLGTQLGPCRLPQRQLSSSESASLIDRLHKMGFFKMIGGPKGPTA